MQLGSISVVFEKKPAYSTNGAFPAVTLLQINIEIYSFNIDRFYRFSLDLIPYFRA